MTYKVTNGRNFAADMVEQAEEEWAEQEQEQEAGIKPPKPADILAAAIKDAESKLPGIEFTFERNVACWTYDVFVGCGHCGKRESLFDITYTATEDIMPGVLEGLLVKRASERRAKCVAVECIDPMDRMVDGLSVRRCLERYTAWQRESKDGDWREGEIWSGPRPSLTAAQQAAARLAWSSELKLKQAEARAKERVEVVVDDNRWEE